MIHDGAFYIPKEFKPPKLLLNVIHKCIQYDPEKRFSVNMLLKHPYFAIKDLNMVEIKPPLVSNRLGRKQHKSEDYERCMGLGLGLDEKIKQSPILIKINCRRSKLI